MVLGAMLLGVALSMVTSLGSRAVAQEAKLRTMKYTNRLAQHVAPWQADVRSKLFPLMKLDDLLAKRAEIPLNPKVLKTEDHDAYQLRQIEINSTPKRRIIARITLPKEAKGPFPAVVCIPGHGGTREDVYAKASAYKGFAAELAARGYVTIATNVGQHKVYEEGRTLMGERLWDLMRCVDYLASLPEVDAKRIGCGGLSLGGEMAMWLGGMETRMAATVSAGFLTRMDQMEQNHCMCWKFPGLRELVDFTDIYALTAPRPLLCQNGEKEPPSQFPPSIARPCMAEIRTTYADAGKPENAALFVHGGGHEIALENLLEFFDRHLAGKPAPAAPSR